MPEEAQISVLVKPLGFLEQYAQQPGVVLKAQPGCTVADILQQIVETLGADFRNALLDSIGNVNGGIEIVLNHELISSYRLSEIQLWKDSEIMLVPMIAGGDT